MIRVSLSWSGNLSRLANFPFFPLYFAVRCSDPAPCNDQAVIVVIVTLLPNITPHYVRTTCPRRVCLAHKGLYESLNIYSEH